MSARPAKSASTKKVEINEKPDGLVNNEPVLSLWMQYPFACVSLAFVMGFVIASYAPSGSLVISDPELDTIKRRSFSWSGVAGITNQSDLCSKTSCTAWDAIVVLGGGPEDANGLPVWTKKRLDVVLEIYECCLLHSSDRTNRLKIITTSAGTAHVPNPLDAEGFYITEAKAAANYLMRHGVSGKDVLQESASWDTIGNAFFLRLMHTDVRRWHRFLLVTSDFHMDRSRAIFEWVFGLPPEPARPGLARPGPGPTADGGSNTTSPYTIDFLSVADQDIAEDLVRDRRRREAASLANVHKRAAEIASLSALHEWLYTAHGAYASAAAIVRLQGSERRIYNGR